MMDWQSTSQHDLYHGRMSGRLGPAAVDEDAMRISPFPFEGFLLNGVGLAVEGASGGHHIVLNATLRYR